MIEIRHSTTADLVSFYDTDAFPWSVRAWSIFKDGALSCVYGYTIKQDNCFVFCNISGKHGRVEVARTAKKALSLLAKDKKTLKAVQDDELCTSQRFLEFLGFRRIGNSLEFEYGGNR